MPRSRPFILLISLVFLLFVTGCGKTPEPPAEPTVPVTKAHMADHFAKVREVEEAIIRGDLDAAKTPAQWIADHQDASEVPAAEKPIKDMRAAARSVASATDISNAAIASAGMLGACGRCHAASKIEPKLPPATEPAAKGDRAKHMMEHQLAIDRMYHGLIAPVSGEWQKGAEALKAAPLRDKAMKDIEKEAIAAEARTHELAERAINAADQSSRITIYGEIVGSCASCHGLHGRIWGPGLPKETPKEK